MSSDLNNYDVEHAVTAHAGMTAAEWQSIYDQAWHLYYSPEHIATLLRRAKVSGIRTTRLAFTIFYFYASYAFEHVHPLQSGVLRRKIANNAAAHIHEKTSPRTYCAGRAISLGPIPRACASSGDLSC